MNVTCSAIPCPVILDCSCVHYSGANLIYTGINTNDTLCVALEKIDGKFQDAGLGYIFTNGITQAFPGTPVKLGGALIEPTTISNVGYPLTVTANLIAGAHVTIGGTSSQFVKGDGSLDSTSYQPAGNYIRGLTGDGTATGPGVVPFTLATVNGNPGTYGTPTKVPIITVNAKGLVTSITQLPIAGGGGGGGTVTSVGVSAGTGISASVANPTTTPVITITNTAPDQTVVLNSGTGISVTGTYPNFTITATGTGGVTSVTASLPLSSSGGATPNISITQASGSTDGYLSSGDWTTFNNKVGGSGTTNYVPKFSNTGTPATIADSQIFDNGTSVGIGTVTPSSSFKLDVVGSVRASNFGYFGNDQVRINTSTSGYVDLYDSTERKMLIGDGPTDIAGFRTYNGNIFRFDNNQDFIPLQLARFSSQIIATVGTNVHNVIESSPILNSSGGTTLLRGFYYNPNQTITGGTVTNIAFENASGDIIHGNLAGVGTRMVTADSTGTLGTTSIPTVGDAIYHGTASGTDTYTVTISGPTGYNDGDAYLIRFTNGNTTGATLNVNGLGAIPLYRNNDGPLLGGDIADEGEMICIYNSALVRFQVIGISPNSLLSYVTNDDSVTITKGQVVYAFGGTGDRMTVKLANNTGDATSARTVGLVLSASIGAGQKGFIMMQGLLDGLNILPTATYSDGDSLYLGATPGSITNIKPYAPAHLVYIGTVTTASNGSSGRLYVNIQNGYELDELHNVQAQSPSLNDTLYYDSAVSPGQWKTASISTILGYTPVGPDDTDYEYLMMSSLRTTYNY